MTDKMGSGDELVPRVEPSTLWDDPNAALAALRAGHRLIKIGDNSYMALRAKDVLSLLANSDLRRLNGVEYLHANQIQGDVAARIVRHAFGSPRDRKRSAAHAHLAILLDQHALEAMRARMRETAGRLIALLPFGETFDFVERIAAPLAAEATANLLGLPRSEASYFAERAAKISRATSLLRPRERPDGVETAARELFAYVNAYLRYRLASPRNDGLTRIAKMWRARQATSLDDLTLQVIDVMIRNCAVQSAFAMLVAEVLQSPTDWSRLKSDRSALSDAVSEAMRLNPPAGSLLRCSDRDVYLGGQAAPAGATLFLSTASAMRDPALYANPDAFEIRRKAPPRHQLAFGAGALQCAGAQFVRLQLEESLDVLINVEHDFEMTHAPRLLGVNIVRPATPMPVRLVHRRQRVAKALG